LELFESILEEEYIAFLVMWTYICVRFN